MRESVDAPSSWWLNVGLLVLGVVTAVLAYALAVRVLTPRADPVRESNPGGLHGDIIQVEIHNGCGVDDVAAQSRHYLRDKGFDVVEVGNYTTQDVENSIVIDRVGDLEAARKVANAMGIPYDRVQQDIREDYLLDASIVIGMDYRTLKPFRHLRQDG